MSSKTSRAGGARLGSGNTDKPRFQNILEDAPVATCKMAVRRGMCSRTFPVSSSDADWWKLSATARAQWRGTPTALAALDDLDQQASGAEAVLEDAKLEECAA